MIRPLIVREDDGSIPKLAARMGNKRGRPVSRRVTWRGGWYVWDDAGYHPAEEPPGGAKTLADWQERVGWNRPISETVHCWHCWDQGRGFIFDDEEGQIIGECKDCLGIGTVVRRVIVLDLVDGILAPGRDCIPISRWLSAAEGSEAAEAAASCQGTPKFIRSDHLLKKGYSAGLESWSPKQRADSLAWVLDSGGDGFESSDDPEVIMAYFRMAFLDERQGERP